MPWLISSNGTPPNDDDGQSAMRSKRRECEKSLRQKESSAGSVFDDQEPYFRRALEESLGENHMALKNVNERLTADRRITAVFKNLRLYESLDEHAQTHPSSPKRRRMWIFFAVGFAAGIIGFVLLFFR
jgi:hypothetical protein